MVEYSVQSGKAVCDNSHEWDKGKSQEDRWYLNMEWLRLCRDETGKIRTGG